MRISILSLMLALPLVAEVPAIPPTPRIPVRPPQPPPPPSAAPSAGNSQDTLNENVRIRLNGQIFQTIKLDSSITGIGPIFTLQRPSENGSILSSTYEVDQMESGYRVEYSIGMRIRVMTSAQNYEYQEVSMKGTVKCRPDQPVVISQDGDAPLILTISPVEPGK